MHEIKMVDLHTQYMRIKSEIDSAISEVLESTLFIQGPQVDQFAKSLRSVVETQAVVPCANGTDALQIAMMGLDLKPGDEVILPVHTYVATAEVIALLGLTPVFVDVDEESFNIDPKKIEAKVTSRTKAIVPVHLYGQCADMEEIIAIANRNHLLVIEDAAQALGAVYTFSDGKRKSAGTMGIVGTTSFFPSKNLGCFGDGGALFASNADLGEKLRIIANHGQRVKYHHEAVGVNSRLDTLQAAILNVKLKYLDDYTRRRNKAADFYDRQLAHIAQVKVPTRFPNSTHVFHQYTLKAEQRDELKSFLAEKGIPTMIYYPIPLHMQKAYQQAGVGLGAFPVSEKLSQTVISLPIHTEMTDEEQTYICDCIRMFYSRKK